MDNCKGATTTIICLWTVLCHGSLRINRSYVHGFFFVAAVSIKSNAVAMSFSSLSFEISR